ncbi:RNA polymerase sigma factor [Chloroflexota bacterium]
MDRNKVRGNKKNREDATAVTLDSNKIIGLVGKAISGDIEAFGELYSNYLVPIYRYIYYHIKDKMTAEDLTEEVFIKAWRGIRSCKGKEQTFSAWLYRIAHNHMIDYFRSTQRYSSMRYRSTDMSNISEVINNGTEAKLELQRLLETVSLLPQNQKQLIILKFIEGLDNREIALIMNKSPGAIRVLQMRALTKLRRNLTREKLRK